MPKKTTLEILAAQIAKGFEKQGKEIHDLTETLGFVVKHMATKDDITLSPSESKSPQSRPSFAA